MAPNEYQELADFFVARLERMQAETRTFVQVSVESLRDEIRVVADGVLANGRRLEEHGTRIDALSARVDRLTDRMGGLERTMVTRFDANEARLRAIEGP